MKTNSKIATAIFAGLAAGAAVWYFMSADDGKHRWENFVGDVTKFGENLKEKAQRTAMDVQDKAGRVADYVHTKKNEAKDYASSKAQDGMNFTENTAQQASDFATKAYNNAKNEVNS